MDGDTPTSPMLTATPTGLLAADFTFAQNREPLGTLKQAKIREKAQIELDGTWYTFSNQLIGSSFLLEDESRLLATAKKRRFRRAFDLSVGTRDLALEVGGTFIKGGRYSLLEDGRQIGELVKKPLVRSATARLPEDLPLSVRAGIFRIALMMWRRARSGD